MLRLKMRVTIEIRVDSRWYSDYSWARTYKFFIHIKIKLTFKSGKITLITIINEGSLKGAYEPRHYY